MWISRHKIRIRPDVFKTRDAWNALTGRGSFWIAEGPVFAYAIPHALRDGDDSTLFIRELFDESCGHGLRSSITGKEHR